ncbi:hypothetical protein [Vibrio marisflavi]|uniref:Uncharacterized protein n=1 Tax=Vibrio marisflavi CECT 7928 TaxID=634439 RepID=A0ABM9A358_9VIBR|nr:hypothetical protein [Vibrio marisflavi]CAH0538835.1 hypothetical protein VMF7928_01694 [Vibrio marisflavi CECT 7928]
MFNKRKIFSVILLFSSHVMAQVSPLHGIGIDIGDRVDYSTQNSINDLSFSKYNSNKIISLFTELHTLGFSIFRTYDDFTGFYDVKDYSDFNPNQCDVYTDANQPAFARLCAVSTAIKTDPSNKIMLGISVPLLTKFYGKDGEANAESYFKKVLPLFSKQIIGIGVGNEISRYYGDWAPSSSGHDGWLVLSHYEEISNNIIKALGKYYQDIKSSSKNYPVGLYKNQYNRIFLSTSLGIKSAGNSSTYLINAQPFSEKSYGLGGIWGVNSKGNIDDNSGFGQLAHEYGDTRFNNYGGTVTSLIPGIQAIIQYDQEFVDKNLGLTRPPLFVNYYPHYFGNWWPGDPNSAQPNPFNAWYGYRQIYGNDKQFFTGGSITQFMDAYICYGQYKCDVDVGETGYPTLWVQNRADVYNQPGTKAKLFPSANINSLAMYMKYYTNASHWHNSDGSQAAIPFTFWFEGQDEVSKFPLVVDNTSSDDQMHLGLITLMSGSSNPDQYWEQNPISPGLYGPVKANQVKLPKVPELLFGHNMSPDNNAST